MVDEHWPLVALGELTENFDGRRIPVKEIDRKAGPYPYYGASGVVDYVNDFLFDGEYLLIGEDGENLRTRQTPIAFIAKGKFWVNNHAHIVRGNHRADTHYLSYVLSQTNIGGYLTGSTMPKLTQGSLNKLRVICPPLPEQKRIASFLGALDDKIELNRRMNAPLNPWPALSSKAGSSTSTQSVPNLTAANPPAWTPPPPPSSLPPSKNPPSAQSQKAGPSPNSMMSLQLQWACLRPATAIIAKVKAIH